MVLNIMRKHTVQNNRLAHSLIGLYLLLTSYYVLPACRNESPPVLLNLHLSSLLILFSGHKVDKLTDKIDQFIDQFNWSINLMEICILQNWMFNWTCSQKH